MPLVPRNIFELSAYKAGKPIDEVRRELHLDKIVKLASNENPLGPPKSVQPAIIDGLSISHRYPDPAGFALRTKLAKRFNLTKENVILGAGSEGIMSTIMRTFLLDDDEIIAAQGSFIGFKVLAKASGNPTHYVPMKDFRYDLQSMAKKINDYTKLIYIANPDNPTGTYVTVSEFDAFMKHVPQRVLVILDEAYFEFAQETEDYPDSMHYRYDNVITLRTFSKVYGLAGLRVGYGFAHDVLIANLTKVKLPFEVSVPATSAALAILDDKDYLAQSLAINTAGKIKLMAKLDQLEIRYLNSVTNFLTLVFESPDKASSFATSLLHKGVIVRYLDAFDQPLCVRITIGTEDEMDFLFNALKSIYD